MKKDEEQYNQYMKIANEWNELPKEKRIELGKYITAFHWLHVYQDRMRMEKLISGFKRKTMDEFNNHKDNLFSSFMKQDETTQTLN